MLWSSVFCGRDIRRRGPKVPKALTDNLLLAVVKSGFWWSFSLWLSLFSFSRGPSFIAYSSSSWCYLSQGPVRSSLQYQPLQCGEAMIRLSDSHYPAYSERACCPQISPPCSHSLWQHIPPSCHPFSLASATTNLWTCSWLFVIQTDFLYVWP